MSAALFALVIGGGLFLVSVVLPIVSFVRTTAAGGRHPAAAAVGSTC